MKINNKNCIDAFRNTLYKDVKGLNQKYVTYFLQDSNTFFIKNAFDNHSLYGN